MFVGIDASRSDGVGFVLSHPFANKEAKGWGTAVRGD